MTEVIVELPSHLRTLARVGGPIRLQLHGEATIRALLDALESSHPELRGTIRDHATGRRRAYMRYFGGGHDLSFEGQDTRLPEPVTSGAEPFRVLGAIAGGSALSSAG